MTLSIDDCTRTILHCHRALNGMRCNRTAAFWLCRRAAAAVEFALIVPVILAALTGLAGFGLVVYQNMQLTNAAQAGAQLAVIDSSNPTAIETAVVNATSLPITSANVVITEFCECADGSAAACGSTCPLDGRTARGMLTVTVTMDADILFWGGAVTLTQSATVRTQ